MNKPNEGSSGTTGSVSGATDTSQTDNAANPDTSTDSPEPAKTVPYEAHRKLLGEKKKADELLRSLADKEKIRFEDEARQKEDYKTLLASREKELAEEREKHGKLQSRINTGAKLRAVLDGIKGTVDKEYYDLIPVDKVVLDPETGLPDEMTVRDAVKLFESKYSKVISPKEVKLPPSGAAKGGVTSFADELRAAKSQKELDAVLKKHGKA